MTCRVPILNNITRSVVLQYDRLVTDSIAYDKYQTSHFADKQYPHVKSP